MAGSGTTSKTSGSRGTVDGKPPMRAALYLRQSRDFTGEGAAVARQREDCERLCAERGWTVVKVYDDNDKSAAGKRKRPGFEQMVVDAKTQPRSFDVIVGWHMDRLTRTLRDYLPLIELAEKHGVGTITVAGGLDLSTDVGQTLGGLLAVVANGEIKRKGARQTRANEQLAGDGHPSIGGAAPLGFRDEPVLVGSVERRRRVVHEPDAAHVRKAYESLLAGRSVSAVARDLAAAGCHTIKGKLFRPNQTRELLLAPRNAGLREYNGEIVGKAAWEPIVDEATWRAAVAVLDDPARRTTPHGGGTRKHLGVSIFRCGVCADGTTMRTEITGDGHHSRRRYACKGGKHLIRAADPIDAFVIDAVIERLSRADAGSLLVDVDRADLVALQVEAAELRTRLDELADACGDGDITVAQMKRSTAGVRERLAEVEAQMTHTDRSLLLAEIIDSADPVAVWRGYGLDRQRAIITTLCSVTVHSARPGGNSRLVGTARPVQPGTVTVDFHG